MFDSSDCLFIIFTVLAVIGFFSCCQLPGRVPSHEWSGKQSKQTNRSNLKGHVEISGPWLFSYKICVMCSEVLRPLCWRGAAKASQLEWRILICPPNYKSLYNECSKDNAGNQMAVSCGVWFLCMSLSHKHTSLCRAIWGSEYFAPKGLIHPSQALTLIGTHTPCHYTYNDTHKHRRGSLRPTKTEDIPLWCY